MVDVNHQDGTISFEAGGVSYILRPDWRAIAGIEHDIGCGLVPLAGRFFDRTYGLKDMATLLFHGLKSSGTAGVTYERVCTEVIKNGLLNIEMLGAAVAFCSHALTGGEPPKKDVAAA